jgi:hypothetical protein
MRHWGSNQPGSVSWTSGTVSLVTTTALFAAAFLAMRTVRFTALDFPRVDRIEPTVVRLTPPVPPVEPARSVTRPAPTSVPVGVSPPSTAVQQPTLAPMAPVIRPVDVAPMTRPPEPVRDTSIAGSAPGTSKPSLTDLVPLRDVPTFPPRADNVRRPAPFGPAGVTARAGVISTGARDAIATAKMVGIGVLAARYKPTAQEKEAIRQQNEPGLPEYGRAARMDGQPRSVPLMNGGSAVAIPLGSIAFPLFSPGPSPAERKRNAVIDAENRLLLRRLQDRVALLRDSVRADSLKRDSLARAIRP